MATDTQSPIPEEMLDAIIKTFIVQHADDSDEHLAQALVYNAGRLAWRMRESGLVTEQKTSISDVVTAADRAAEKFVADCLRAIRPDDGLLGEEGTSVESSSGRTWVIDPVDGTSTSPPARITGAPRWRWSKAIRLRPRAFYLGPCIAPPWGTRGSVALPFQRPATARLLPYPTPTSRLPHLADISTPPASRMRTSPRHGWPS